MKNPQLSFTIAVTGHRFITTDDRLYNSIKTVLKQIVQHHRNSEIYLYSALAEGSNQLVAEGALSFPQIKLIVALSLPEEEYLKGFATDIGKKAFYELTQNAHRMFTLSEQDDYLTAVEYLGKYLQDHCELLWRS